MYIVVPYSVGLRFAPMCPTRRGQHSLSALHSVSCAHAFISACVVRGVASGQVCVTEQAISVANAGGITSGGGFGGAVGIARPWYQDGFVSNYVNTMGGSAFTAMSGLSASVDALGRGVPDIAAFAGNIVMYQNGQTVLVGGTSKFRVSHWCWIVA